MYCCTFYSYKGGVGRTLALANVAVEHARLGRKVLVVDFDLEAPGLSTLAPFEQASEKPGLIDFVQNFQFDGKVPDAKKFIYTCIYKDANNSFDIDVMPAGCGLIDYSEAYSSIDWGDLYENKNGFLLMEDLRAQWKNAGYDYVFIDSRTGHTDAGGICTRQLPDAVAVVFFPNLQNLKGLEQTVPAIRASEGRPEPIETLFVASRVPRLDDEHGLLKTLLDKFRSGLLYSTQDLVLIEQYDSLSLLDQELFVLTRPTSGLAKQYVNLATKIAQLNVEDPDGAVAFLRGELQSTRRIHETVVSGGDIDEQREESRRLSRISEAHENDALIQLLLARVFYARRSIVESAIATDNALAADQQTRASDGLPESFLARVHQLRLRIFSEMDLPGTVIESATAILNSEDATDTAILDAINNLASVAPEKLPTAEDLPALERAEPRRLLSVAKRLTWSAQATELAAVLVEKIFDKFPDFHNIRPEDLTDIQLPLIATGRFELAYSVYEKFSAGQPPRLDVLFNSAMAKWGKDREPDIALLKEVYKQFESMERVGSEANHNECRALVEGILGFTNEMRLSLSEAKNSLSRQIEFSCWNYMNVPPQTFVEHLSSIEKFILNGGAGPAFLEQHHTARHSA